METVQNVLKGKSFFIFDLDNTLINTEKSHLQGVYNVCKSFPNKKGLYQKMLDRMEAIKIGGDSLSASDRYSVYEDLKLDNEVMSYKSWDTGETVERVPDKIWDVQSIDKLYWKGVGDYVEFINEAQDVLFYLSDSGKGISILTNGGEVQHRKLSLVRGELEPMVSFDMAVVTGDYGKRHYKPDGYCLNKILSYYDNKRSECVYIGDRVYEDKGVAENCGVDFVLYDPSEKHNDFDGSRIFDLKELIQ